MTISDIWYFFCRLPIIGVVMGEVAYFSAISSGYTMTHSITAYAAVPALVYLLMAGGGGIAVSFFALVVLLMTGKSSIVVVLSVLVFFMTLRKWIWIYVAIGFLVVSFGSVIVHFDMDLPTKTGIRVTALLRAISQGELSFDLLNNISSSRLYEIQQIWAQWRATNFDMIFGLGADTTVIKASTGQANSTIHMSYLKVLTSLGVLSLPFFILVLILLIRSISILFRRVDRSGADVIVSLSVATGLLIANFQFTLFQNAHLWIMSGVLLSVVRPRSFLLGRFLRAKNTYSVKGFRKI